VIKVCSEEVDLRYTPISCTSHPVVRLRNVIGSLVERGVREVRVFFKAEDIPEDIMKLFLSKHGYLVKESRRLDDGSLMFIARREM